MMVTSAGSGAAAAGGGGGDCHWAGAEGGFLKPSSMSCDLRVIDRLEVRLAIVTPLQVVAPGPEQGANFGKGRDAILLGENFYPYNLVLDEIVINFREESVARRVASSYNRQRSAVARESVRPVHEESVARRVASSYNRLRSAVARESVRPVQSIVSKLQSQSGYVVRSVYTARASYPRGSSELGPTYTRRRVNQPIISANTVTSPASRRSPAPLPPPHRTSAPPAPSANSN
ncbi:unnamed protein product [Colias eurytheme]|nr:unnamed protein product [Colias eurytheme]